MVNGNPLVVPPQLHYDVTRNPWVPKRLHSAKGSGLVSFLVEYVCHNLLFRSSLNYVCESMASVYM